MIDAGDGSSFAEAPGIGRRLIPEGPLRSASRDPHPSGAGALPSLQGLGRARLVLEIAPGERRREPAFGCRVHLLPEIETAEDRQIAAALIEESLEMWLPDLRVERARVESSEDGVLGISLRREGAWHPLSIRHRRGARNHPLARPLRGRRSFP
jgi:hypothetical protein